MKYFKLFANCIPVKGYTASIICDVQKNRYQYIPNELFILFESEKLMNYQSCEDPKVKEYIDFLVDKKYGFLLNDKEKEFFPPLDLDFDYPGHLSNAIIDVDSESKHDFVKIMKELSDLGCSWIQIRIFDSLNHFEITKILSIVNVSEKPISIELLIKYNDELNKESITLMTKSFLNVVKIFVHSSVNEDAFEIEGCQVIYSSSIVTSEKCCGIISSDYFSLNIATFTESQKNNSCLNKKVGIDKRGNIKNCPSMNISYGNISDTSISEALETDSFKNLWDLSKDRIDVCNQCEFRYICTDCRAYVEEPLAVNADGVNYSKPLKCGYNPQTNIWSEWSTNPLKTAAIDFYGISEKLIK